MASVPEVKDVRTKYARATTPGHYLLNLRFRNPGFQFCTALEYYLGSDLVSTRIIIGNSKACYVEAEFASDDFPELFADGGIDSLSICHQTVHAAKANIGLCSVVQLSPPFWTGPEKVVPRKRKTWE